LLFLNIFSFAIKIGFSQATVPIAKGSNFNLYYVVGDELMFQHLKTDYMKAFNASVKVTSGTLNGTDGKLEMYIAEGMISFKSLDSAQLEPHNAVIIVNGEHHHTSSTNIQNGDIVVIKWTNPETFAPLWPFMFTFGMIGLVCMFGGPLYAISKWKQHEYYEGFAYGLTITVLGLALFIAWLWS